MHDVVIAGGGPVGLFLAGELALSGCSVVVLERDPEPDSLLKALPLGLRGLNAGSAETLYRRGLLEAMTRASGVDPQRVGADPEAVAAPAPRELSHFAGMTLAAADIDTAALPPRLPGPAMEGFMTSLEAAGSVLCERATELGVEIIRNAPVTAVAQDAGSVLVTAGGQEYRGRWLVGCDGGRSAVRRLAGFEFVGTEPLFTGYVAEVAFAEPDRLPLGFNLTPNGMYLRTPFAGHLGMMDFDGAAFDRSRPLTREHLQTVLRRISDTDVTLTEVHLASSFTDRAMQTTTYRKRRVLLAGDAAHIHSPLGGQGLNLGIGDAVNLGWKLAATVRGWAPEGLLDTYTTERHPVGAAVLDRSRAQVATMKPGPNAPALRRLVHDLMRTTDGTTHVYRQTSGLFHRYDLGSERPFIGCSPRTSASRTAPGSANCCAKDRRWCSTSAPTGRCGPRPRGGQAGSTFPGRPVGVDDIIAAHLQLAARARAHGVKVHAATIAPYGSSEMYSPEGDQAREQVNAWIRTSNAFDGILDFDAVWRDPADPTHIRADLHMGDHLHGNDAGYAALAESIGLSLFD